MERGAFDLILDGPFNNKIPDEVRCSAVWVNDTMVIAKASAEQVFGVAVNNETIMKVYDRICLKIAQDKQVKEERV